MTIDCRALLRTGGAAALQNVAPAMREAAGYALFLMRRPGGAAEANVNGFVAFVAGGVA